jgi:hypothetical protein
MELKSKIKELEEIKIGFDLLKAEEKIDKILILINLLDQYKSDQFYDKNKDEIIQILQQAYGTIYEVGNTKQTLTSKNDIILAEKILPIAKRIYGKSKNLIPYLNLNLNNNISNKIKYESFQKEISEINNSN